MSPGKHQIVLVLLLCGLASQPGCNNSHEAEQMRVAIRDSAGVAIAENRLNALTPSCALTEQLRIGVATGDPAYELYGVFDSARLSDGSIAVVNQAGEVRLYSGEGAHRFTFGRRGGGPGEFRTPLVIAAIRGDTLVIGDEAPWRFSYFDREGRYQRAFELPPEMYNIEEAGAWEDGRVLVGMPCCRPGVAGEFVDRKLVAVLFTPSGRADTVAEFPFDRFGITSVDPTLILGRPIFGAVGAIQPIADGIVYSTAREPGFRVVSLNGETLRIVRWTAPGHAVEPEDLQAYRADIAGRLSHLPRRFTEARTGEHIPVADSFPALLTLRASLRGDVWVQEYPLPRRTGPDRSWLVFDPDGSLRCRATLPRMSVHEVGSNFIRGRVQDELGVEYIVEYEITEPAGDPASSQ